MKLVDRVVLQRATKLLLETAHTVNFTLLLDYLLSSGCQITRDEYESIETQTISTKRAHTFLQLINSNQSITIGQVTDGLQDQLGKTSPLVKYLKELPTKISQELQDEKVFIAVAEANNVRILKPYLKCEKGGYEFVAIGERNESFIRNNDKTIHVVLNQSQNSELQALLKLSVEETEEIKRALDKKMELNEVLKKSELIETCWEKVGVELNMNVSSIHAIRSSLQLPSANDKAMELLNKAYQKHYDRFTGKFLLNAIIMATNSDNIEQLFISFGLGKFLNKSEAVIKFIQTPS